MSDLAELIGRLEAATEPDPHLDAEIEAALRGGVPAYRTASRHQFGPSTVLNHGEGNPWDGWESAPSFTGSLDAALSLGPEECPWQVGDDRGRSPSSATICTITPEGKWVKDTITCKGTTPALALCIAALRARGEQPPSSRGEDTK